LLGLATLIPKPDIQRATPSGSFSSDHRSATSPLATLEMIDVACLGGC
jgi:hypothetical protein